MIANIKISIPLTGVLKSYQKKWVRHDLIAGLTVAAVAVPQAMAYSQLAGIPLVFGLYTALAAMLFFAVFTTSRFAIVGPDAAMAALTGAAIAPLALGDPTRYMYLVGVLAILIGLVCLVALFAKLGILAEFISRPILLGYMAGLALAVIASQLPKLFGLPIPSGVSLLNAISYIFSHVSSISWITFVLSALLFGIAHVLQKYYKKTPSYLIILVGTIILSWAFSLSSKGVPVVGTVPTGLPLPVLPKINISDLQNLVVPALMISLVSYANTISTARAFATSHADGIEAPQEFFGLGVANIASGIFGGMPVAASGARTAVNYQSKAVTQVSQLFGAVCIVIVLLFIAPVLSYLPQAALGVIVILAVRNLFNIKELRSIWRAWNSEAYLAILTLIGVTLLGIFQGLILAVMLAILNFVRKNSLPKYVLMGVAEDGKIRDLSRPPKTTTIPGMIIFRFDAPLYFINANYFRDTVYQLIDSSDEPVLWFLWDAETITELDSTAGQMLRLLIKDLNKKGITFAIARMKGPIRHTIQRSRRLSHLVTKTPHFTTMGEAIEAYHEFEKQQKTK